VLALSERPEGVCELETLARFVTNPSGAAIVNAVRPIRQLVLGEAHAHRRYLVIVSAISTGLGEPVQVQLLAEKGALKTESSAFRYPPTRCLEAIEIFGEVHRARIHPRDYRSRFRLPS